MIHDQFISHLWQKTSTHLAFLLIVCLDSLFQKVRLQIIVKTLELPEAQINRDSMAKAIYSGIFQYLIWRMNRRLLARESKTEEKDGGYSDDDENETEMVCDDL